MFEIERLTRDGEVEALALEWAALWRRAEGASAFQSPEWLLSWWRIFGNGRPVVLAAREGGRLAGLLPLYRFEENGRRKLLPFGVSLSDYIDALVDPQAPAVAAALLGELAGIPDWDECHLPDLPAGAALRAAPCPSGLADRLTAGPPCLLLPLPRAVERLRDTVPKKMLQNLRRARARAAVEGGVSLAAADRAGVKAGLQTLFELHEKGWRRRGEPGVLADPAVRAFHLAAAPALGERGILRLLTLALGGRPIAAYYGFAAKGLACAYLMGFDPEYERLSPGAQMLGAAIEAAIAEGAREMHFLRGAEAYKHHWGPVNRPNAARTLWRRC